MFKKTALDRIPRYKRTALKGGVPIFGFVLPKYNLSNLSDGSRTKIKSLRLLDPNYIPIHYDIKTNRKGTMCRTYIPRCYTARPRVIEMCGVSLASKPSMLAAAQHHHLVKHSISSVVEFIL